MTLNERVKKIVEILDNKKGVDVKVLKVTDLTSVADYFIVANGTSTTHIKSLADEVDFQMSQLGETAKTEGKASDWILLDFSDIIVHIFLPTARDHYNLERLWAQAEEVDIENL